MIHIHRLPTRRGSWMAGFHQPSTVVTMTRYTAPRATVSTMPSADVLDGVADLVVLHADRSPHA